MHPHFLTKTVAEIAHPLSITFRKSLKSKLVLAEWKKGRITAPFKKGSKKVANNYRPVSLISAVCKCLEKLVR